MTQQQNNIFLTWENLAFALPLILVCASYAYFKYVPLHIGLPILGVIGLFFQLKSTVKKHKNKKLENLDEDFVNDLAGDPDEEKKAKEALAAEKARKAKAKLEQRLAQERKANAKQQTGKKKKKGKSADDDEEDLDAFVKDTKNKKNK
mmetsp:Transcript_2340/g.3467  ORF Transcript_2340/g.3467 Transcript_2340/m.3467 type:complete len:148 (+) Transcript_2340:144-587(+)|eukprot:CAMPEP_0194226780 /NCGR_PEP_ID=MMETSP0156-20130528/42516_1 /TAXON_ID=33649 /ORGANISM="Thalassionema nitzschioides, Strain L26-B" /LENGTH=147 /DNA_ID=CAMNT_0038959237 /DNA_START=81 /DNA_END=524 /DNA_ORIENTATION=-